jgi:hypothetical protein
MEEGNGLILVQDSAQETKATGMATLQYGSTTRGGHFPLPMAAIPMVCLQQQNHASSLGPPDSSTEYTHRFPNNEQTNQEEFTVAMLAKTLQLGNGSNWVNNFYCCHRSDLLFLSETD